MLFVLLTYFLNTLSQHKECCRLAKIKAKKTQEDNERKKEENIYSQTKPSWPEAFLLFESQGTGGFGRKKNNPDHISFLLLWPFSSI